MASIYQNQPNQFPYQQNQGGQFGYQQNQGYQQPQGGQYGYQQPQPDYNAQSAFNPQSFNIGAFDQQVPADIRGTIRPGLKAPTGYGWAFDRVNDDTYISLGGASSSRRLLSGAENVWKTVPKNLMVMGRNAKMKVDSSMSKGPTIVYLDTFFAINTATRTEQANKVRVTGNVHDIKKFLHLYQFVDSTSQAEFDNASDEIIRRYSYSLAAMIDGGIQSALEYVQSLGLDNSKAWLDIYSRGIPEQFIVSLRDRFAKEIALHKSKKVKVVENYEPIDLPTFVKISGVHSSHIAYDKNGTKIAKRAVPSSTGRNKKTLYEKFAAVVESRRSAGKMTMINVSKYSDRKTTSTGKVPDNNGKSSLVPVPVMIQGNLYPDILYTKDINPVAEVLSDLGVDNDSVANTMSQVKNALGYKKQQKVKKSDTIPMISIDIPFAQNNAQSPTQQMNYESFVTGGNGIVGGSRVQVPELQQQTSPFNQGGSYENMISGGNGIVGGSRVQAPELQVRTSPVQVQGGIVPGVPSDRATANFI